MKICGIDEVGRGAFAGPLVAAGVVLSKRIKGLKDSKKLSPKQRQKIYTSMSRKRIEMEVEIISALQINNRGMGWANREIVKRLVKKISADKYIVDGNMKINKTKSVIDGDAKIKCVMAASIVAKVTRDKLMRELHKQHPKYGWKTNVGYGTKFHQKAIAEFGETRYHRSVWVRTVQKNLTP